MMEHFDLKAMNEVVPIQAGMTAMAYAFAKAGFNPAAAAEKQAAEDKAAAKKLAAERAAEALLVRAAAEAAAAEEAARAEAQAAAVQAAAAAAEKAARAEAEAKAAAEAQAEATAAAAAEAQAKAAAEAKAQAAAAAEAQAKADAAAAAAPAAEEKPKADNKKAAAPAAAAAAAPAPAAVASAVAVSSADVKILRDKSGAGMMDCKKALAENGNDMEAASEWLRKKGLASAAKKGARVAAEGAVGSYIHAGARIGVLVELNCETDFVARGEVFQTLLKDLAMQIAACPDVQVVDTSDVDEAWKAKETEIEMGKEDILSKPEKLRAQIVVGRVAKRVNEVALLEQAYIRDTDKKVGDLIKEKISEIGENIKVRRFSRFNLGEGIEKKENDFAAEVAAVTAVKAPEPKKEAPAPAAASAAAAASAVAVSSADVKILRDKSGAGMMDCKKALAENGNDMEAASEWLRKKGLASAAKKGARVAAEGAVGSYIHAGARIGVLVELNCETDFVARGEVFQTLLKDLAMQIAACPDVQVVDTSDVDEAWKAKETEIEMGKEDILSKPEKLRAQIVVGRVAKRVNEVALLEQAYIRDTDKKVGDLIKEKISEIGENIKVRRFSRFNLGEGIEKKENDFAAEVAAITGAK